MGRMGFPVALSAALLLQLVAPASAQGAQDPQAGKPPPPRPVPELLEGVEMESALAYEADPKSAQTLRAAFAGKEHARWWIGTGSEGSQVRLLRLRSGERVFALRVDAPGSLELEGAQRDEALAQLELRRALLQFESFDWQGKELVRTAALGALGSLRSRFESAQDARPREIAFLDPRGQVQDSCRAILWESSGVRPVPAALEFWHGEARVWKETVRRVQPMTFTRDAFLPRDTLAAMPPAGASKVIQTPAPEHAARRFALPADASFESARKELERLRSEWAPRLGALGLELEPRGTLELDAELHPRFVILRLSKVPETLPEGFEKISGRSAVGTSLGSFAEIGSAAWSALREKVPPGSKVGAPYVRWSLDPGGPKQVLLLLSWTPAR
jgi:hypothetical protein